VEAYNSRYFYDEDLKKQVRRGENQKDAILHLSMKWALVGILPSLCSSRPAMFISASVQAANDPII
jgi:hypothetical protein